MNFVIIVRDAIVGRENMNESFIATCLSAVALKIAIKSARIFPIMENDFPVEIPWVVDAPLDVSIE